jgi:hypothetical protein
MVTDPRLTPQGPLSYEPAPLARRALFGFIITFVIARTVVLLIMSKRMPNLYFFMHGTHVAARQPGWIKKSRAIARDFRSSSAVPALIPR